MGGIVVIGSINFDLILPCERIPQAGETVHAHTRALAPGGKGANQAVAAARLGAPVALVGAVGSDPLAEDALELLRSANVDLSGVRVVPGPTGIAVVSVADSGGKAILIEGGANRSMDADAVRAQAALIEAADVVVLQGEIPRDGIEAAAELARGRLIMNLAPVVPLSRKVLFKADPLVVNEHESMAALRLFSEHAHGERAVAAAMVDAGVPSVVMNRGAKGALVVTDTLLETVPSPDVDFIDSTGAPDAFVGALAVKLLAGESLVDAAGFATRVGAYSRTTRGAQPSYPWASDTLPD